MEAEKNAQGDSEQLSQITRTAPVLSCEISKELAVILEPQSEFARVAHSIASKIQHMYVDLGVRSIGFIGDTSQSGTTVVAANVAAAFALSGKRTILVETNFRAPRIASMFGLDPERPGLSEWLAGIGNITAWSGYMQPAYPGLVVMPAGNALEAGEATMATELRHLVLELSRMFDVVICDSAPIEEVSSTLAMVSTVERTMIIAKANTTKVNTLVRFEDLVKQCGGQIGGTVYVNF